MYANCAATAAGSSLFDLSRFLVYNADADIRRQVCAAMLDAYFSRLCSGHAKNGACVRFTREAALELFELALVYDTLTLVHVCAFKSARMSISSEAAERAQIEKFWLRTRLAVEDALVLVERHDLRRRFPLHRH